MGPVTWRWVHATDSVLLHDRRLGQTGQVTGAELGRRLALNLREALLGRSMTPETLLRYSRLSPRWLRALLSEEVLRGEAQPPPVSLRQIPRLARVLRVDPAFLLRPRHEPPLSALAPVEMSASVADLSPRQVNILSRLQVTAGDLWVGERKLPCESAMVLGALIVHGSIRAAASSFTPPWSKSTVGDRLQRIEVIMEFPLFDRHSDGMKLNKYGQAVWERYLQLVGAGSPTS